LRDEVEVKEDTKAPVVAPEDKVLTLADYEKMNNQFADSDEEEVKVVAVEEEVEEVTWN